MAIRYPPDEVWEKYYSALGRMMHFFAEIEQELNAAVSLFIEERIIPKEPEYIALIQAALEGNDSAQPKTL